MCLKVADDSCCGNLRTLTITILWINLINGLLSTGSYTLKCVSGDLEFQWSVLPALSFIGILIAAVALYAGVYNDDPPSLMVAVFFEATLFISDLILVVVAVFIVFFDEDFCGEDEFIEISAAQDEEVSCTSLKTAYLILSFFMLLVAVYHWYAMNVIYCYYKKVREQSQENTS